MKPRGNKIFKVTWFFKPIGAGSYWKTVKAFPEQSHVSTYDRYKRYSVSEKINSFGGSIGKYYIQLNLVNFRKHSEDQTMSHFVLQNIFNFIKISKDRKLTSRISQIDLMNFEN